MDDCFAGSPSHSEKRGGGTDKAKAAAAISKMEGGVSLFVRMRVVDDLKEKPYSRSWQMCSFAKQHG